MNSMKILIYKSAEDKIRENSKFTEDLIQEIQELSSDYNIELTMDYNKITNIEKIKESDVIIIFAHGDHDCIYHIYNQVHCENFIDKDNINILAGKKVITFACYTGAELGQLAEHSGCEAYLGFKSKIYREFKDSNDNKEFLKKYGIQPEVFISKIYSIAFHETLLRSFQNNFSFKKLQQYLKFTIKSTLREQLSSEKNFLYHLQCEESIHRTADSINVTGSENAEILSPIHSQTSN